ncbi:MAG: RDD family protein [Pseudomonadota bacterium]
MSAKKDTAAKRARRERKARESRLLRDFRPPEGVSLNFEVAGLGARIGAQMLDLILTFLLVLSIVLSLTFAGVLGWTGFVTLASLGFFFIRTPYYILAELLWNGQTLGKRMVGLRVVSANGRSLTPYSVTVRNLMKEMEVFVPGTAMIAVSALSVMEILFLLVWVTVLIFVPLMNSKRQRLGDIIAGTYVIHQPKAVLLPDVAQAARTEPEERFTFLNHQLDHYGRFELQTLESVLQADPAKLDRMGRNRHAINLAAITDKIKTKIEYTDAIDASDHRAFLQAFYRAQRRYLETRQLFGDKREDKFHQIDLEEKA